MLANRAQYQLAWDCTTPRSASFAPTWPLAKKTVMRCEETWTSTKSWRKLSFLAHLKFLVNHSVLKAYWNTSISFLTILLLYIYACLFFFFFFNYPFPGLCSNCRLNFLVPVCSNVIWLGDLNYRLVAGCDDTHELVKKNDWQALLEKDHVISKVYCDIYIYIYIASPTPPPKQKNFYFGISVCVSVS